MIAVHYAVCSEREGKPMTRAVCSSRTEAEMTLERLQHGDRAAPEAAYWIAELGPEFAAWLQAIPATLDGGLELR